MGDAAGDKPTDDSNQGGDADGGQKADDDNLLEDEAKNGSKSGDDDKDGKDDGKGGDDGGNDGDPVTLGNLKPLLDDVVTKAIEAADRQADKRINQVLDKRLGDDGKGGKAKDDGDAKSGDGGSSSGPAADVVRSTRLAFKEYLDEGIQFLGNEERAFARDLGHSLISGMADITDEDEVGRQVATRVAEQVQSMRKFYEQRTKSALKRRGLLKESDAGGKQPPASNVGGIGAGAEFDQGAKVAEGMFGKKDPASAGAK